MGPLLGWFGTSARDLPWRAPGCTAWGVLVSEVMLQQTPVARVEPVWGRWMRRWPSPEDLAAESPATVLRAWDRLGYPRRALRLRLAAREIAEHHGGEVPVDPALLRTLPGVGEYTAAAVAAFAAGVRVPVVDTNVRRVLRRLVEGADPGRGGVTGPDARLAAALLPDDPTQARAWNAATMELGALVCTARAPRCQQCPVSGWCRWREEGYPPTAASARPPAPWHGTDRQCRGRVMQTLRETTEPLPLAELAPGWPDTDQVRRCVAGLLADRLADAVGGDRYRLPC